MNPAGLSSPPNDTDVKLTARAILIMLVIVGHNQLFREHFYYSAYILIYSFHVGAFFLLATLSPPRPMNVAVLSKMVARFYKPFLIFTLIYGVLYLPIYLRPYDHDAASWIGDMALATSIATAPLLDIATGLKLLWFLPAFMSFCLLYNIQGAVKGRLRAAVWTISVIANATITIVPNGILTLLPFGMGVALFLLFPALLFLHLQCVLATRLGPILILILFVVSSAVIVVLRMEVILSDFWMPNALIPERLLLCDVQLVLGGLACLIIARAVAASRTARWIGERSLHIYLLHAPFNIVIAALLEHAFGSALPWPLAIGCTVGATIGCSVITAHLIEASYLNPLVFSARRQMLSLPVRTLRRALR
ncbi:MAG: acyltransferase family protein [Novosphingobium sp.]